MAALLSTFAPAVVAYTPPLPQMFAARRGSSLTRRTSYLPASVDAHFVSSGGVFMSADGESDAELLEAGGRGRLPWLEEEDDEDRPPPPVSDPGYGPVLLLALLFTANQWARQLPFYTVDFKAAPTEEAIRQFMNLDIGFGEAQYGVLASIGFAALFSLASLVAGGLVDRVDNRILLTGTAAVWSAATVWQASAQSFNEVLGARMLSGVGQAFSNPTSYTILGRLYPAEKRATVNGIYSSGLYFGGGLAALSVLLVQSLGWRDAFAIVGGLGLLSAAVGQFYLPALPPQPKAPESADVALLPADEGSSSEESTAPPATSAAAPSSAEDSGLESTFALLKELVSEPTVALLLLASTLRFLAGFTIGVWIVPFYRQSFAGSIGAEFALIKAAVNGVAGSISATGGGLLADRLSDRDARFNQWVPAAGTLLAIPFWLGTLNAPTLELSLAALFCEYLTAECWFGPTVAGLQQAAPPNAQGLTTGVFSCLTFVGNLAPFAIGLAVSSGDYELPQLLTYSVPVLYAAAAVAFVAAGQAAAARESSRES